MAIQEVIKYEGSNDVLISKFPAEDFNTLSQLIVHESQEAVFFSDGKALDSFKPGRYTLETKNIPLLSKVRNLVTGGVSPFHVEVYFINMATMLDIAWGTPSRFTVKDPIYGYSYNAGANGSFGLKIVDSRKLLLNLVGTEADMSVKHVQKYFKDLIVTQVKSFLAVELSRFSYNEIAQHLDEISKVLEKSISEKILDYGIQVINFYASAVSIDEADLRELKSLDNSMAKKRFEAFGDRDAKIIMAEGEAKSREIQGYTWQQEQQFGVSKAFAQNEGFASNPANMMAQMPVAFSFGEMMRDNVNHSSQAQPAASGVIKCPECGVSLVNGAKFCSSCGHKIEQTAIKHFCINCGSELNAGQRFCHMCGTPAEGSQS